MINFDVSKLPLSVHANRDYSEDKVRHFNKYLEINSSVSGQYGSRNFAKLVELISDIYKGKKTYFVDTRQDTHFELNGKPVSLKRIIENDDNTGLSSEAVIAKEKASAQYFMEKMVAFIPKEPHGPQWEEQITQAAVVKDFIESPKWQNQHVYVRFALSEDGPLSDDQVEKYLSLLKNVDSQGAWLHTNSIVGGASAILLLVMRDMLKNASVDSLETILSRYDKAKNFLLTPREDDEHRHEKIERTDFIQKFYKFAKTRTSDQGWVNWKSQQK